MSFGTLKTTLRSLINRRDLTDELAGAFITRSVRDVERPLRIGPMERVLETSAWDGATNSLLIPPGYLELIDIFTDDGELRQVDKAEYFRTPIAGCRPLVFAKVADRWLLRPVPSAGSTVYLHHYAESLPLAVETDENVWTRAGFNAVLYTAAALAADHFQMEDQHAQRFGAKAEAYVAAMANQDLDEKWAGPMNISRPVDRGEY